MDINYGVAVGACSALYLFTLHKGVAMKKTHRRGERRTFERRLARELSSKELERALGANGTTTCCNGCADD